MRTTVHLVGKAIQDGSKYLPIRNRAAALASTAGPKDYLGQARAIYDDFVKRWRYVRDPAGRELVTTSPQQIYHLVMGGRSEDPGVGLGRGAGDCDDATVAIGAQLASIGFPIRIATIAPQGAPPGRLMSHIFIQAAIPSHGWVTVDPVVHPFHGFGFTPPHSRMALFDLNGTFLEGTGNLRNMSGGTDKGESSMCNVRQFEDYAGFGDCFTGEDEDLLDFRKYGIKGFGIYADSMGILDLGDIGLGMAAEVDIDENGRAWSPALEMTPDDVTYIRSYGRPYHGMLALGDNMEVYQYDGSLGFFKKLFKKIKKKAKKLVHGAASFAKKTAKSLLKKLPGGKYLLKLGQKLWKISKKYLKPLAKFVGKYAKYLAPVAALIPGVGPAVAAGLYTAGKVANLMNKYGIKVAAKASDVVGKLRFPSDKIAKSFTADLKKAAKAEARKGKRPDGRPLAKGRRSPRANARRAMILARRARRAA